MREITRILLGIMCLSLLFADVVPAKEADVEGGKDHPLFNRMPGFYIKEYTEKDFDTHEFRDADLKPVNVDGRFFEIVYGLQPEAKEPSRVEILRNYENAVKKIGGTVLYSDWDGISFMKVVKEDKEIWVQINGCMSYEPRLFIIEKEAMAQKIVANAEALSNDIRSTGHVAVYGIYFDSGKSVVKPESEPALSEIAKLLQGDPGLKLNVVGHTDNVGKMDYNMKLSQARGEAVVQTLVTKYGIASDRLKGYGVGPLAPVASNENEAGKAKNRRVELVNQ